MDETPQSIPWPHWLLRYMVADNPEAFDDLIWSVGGSPPYGGVSWKEAEAVYKLVEGFRGPGRAPKSSFDALRRLVAKTPDRRRAVELFACFDEIVSDSEGYSADPVERGLALAQEIPHRGAHGLFLLFKAGLATREQRTAEASKLTLAGLDELLQAAEEEPLYSGRVAAAAQNAVALPLNAGDVDTARAMLDRVGEVLPPEFVAQVGRVLAARTRAR